VHPTDEQPRARSVIDEAIRTRRIFELEHYVFSEANPVFVKQTGLVDAIGRG